jgi:hypothetical protein
MPVKAEVDYMSEYLIKMVRQLPARDARAYVPRQLEACKERYGEQAAEKLRAEALKQYRTTHGNAR